ncbi:glycoside hydrolase family 5 protein [Neobacillus drentensis]|uniref:glycoside hydrolase family 5 protein n=1 Tax=Neobacillus drentensis TaxID=220684 RepID=UPI001F39E6D0|nr:cellulase family glycosylhydrolase [Neobacillus drentensis]ULT56196.1 glycoside hydrolase family 5 protein [Neobacillus drentensis]
MIKTKIKRTWLIFLFLFLLFSFQTTVPATKQMDFSKGINLNGLFVWKFGNNPLTFYNKKDAKQIKNLGFTYVRIPVDPNYIWNYENDQLLHLSEIKRAIDISNSQGLAVILDLHPTEKITGKQNDPSIKQELYSLWSVLSKELEKYPSDQLSFELFNEPNFTNYSAWHDFMNKSIKAIRIHDTKRTLLIDSNTFSDLETLVSSEPFSDNNLVYVFHYYAPFVFTHQGWQWWGDSPIKELKNIPYPASPGIVAPFLKGLSPEAQSMLKWYGSEKWFQQKIEQQIKQVVNWRDQHKTKVILNEFGVYKKYAKPEDRNAWVRDVRTTVEKYNIGWAFWSYDDNQFGIFSSRSSVTGERSVDKETSKALGLNVK